MCQCRKCKARTCQCKDCEEKDKCGYAKIDDCRWVRIGGKNAKVRGYETHNQYTFSDLEVHHGIPLEDDFSKRLDNDILLTMCERHHGMAEKGDIPRQKILDIVKEQEEKIVG